MKQFQKCFALLMMGIATLSLAACLGDDDDEDNKMTNEQYATYMAQMAGYYDGMTYFYVDDNGQMKLDSVAVSARVVGQGDSTITVAGLPARALARCVSDSAISKAIAAEPDQTLRMKFYINSFNQGYVFFGVYPLSISFNHLEYGGSTHQVSLNFFTYYNNNAVYKDGAADVSYYLFNMTVDGKDQQQFYTLYPSYSSENAGCQFFMTMKK